MSRKLLSTLLVASLATITIGVIAGIVLTNRSTQTEADTLIGGVPIDSLAADGIIVKAAPSDAAPAVTSEQVTARMKEADHDLRFLDVALVTYASDSGGVFPERLAWAVSLDPKSMEPPPLHGPPNLDQEIREAARTLAYAVEFFDAQTGEFLMGTNFSALAEPKP